MKPARPKRTRQRAAGRSSAPRLSPDVIETIETRVGHKFKDKSLLDRAFTHASALHESRGGLGSYQRLEFLGDRVLGLVVAERLFSRRRNEREGALAPRLNRLVNKRACARASAHMDLGHYVMMSPHEIAQGGRERDSTLGDLCEAVTAAIYLDGGLTKARQFIETAFAPQFIDQPGTVKDPKTLLQEWAQSEGHDLPQYRIVSRSGPDHAPVFQVDVQVGQTLSASGQAASKQDAERAAAKALLVAVQQDET